jgi:hypothetical protein
MARTKGSKNKPKQLPVYTEQDVRDLYEKIGGLELDLEKANEVAEQAKDYISDLEASVDFYRKQVNHFLALVNILARGK